MRIQNDLQYPVVNTVNLASDGAIGTAAATVDIVPVIFHNQTTTGRNLTLPVPTDTMAGKVVRVHNSGTATFQMYQVNIESLSSKDFMWTGGNWAAVADNSMGYRDTRAVNRQPQDYAAGIYWEFKQSATISLAPTNPAVGTYVGLQTFRRYAAGTDFSGGQVRQEAESDNGFKYYRYSTSATTWGPWRTTPRLTAPVMPTLTQTGMTSISQTLVRTTTDEDSVTFQLRVACAIPIHTNTWAIITVPNIAGYQTPIVHCDGVYRNSGNPVNLPAAPYMGNEACVYTANTVYVGGYTESVATNRLVMLTIRYVKL